MDEPTIVTIHYNTPELTEALIRSIRKCMGSRPRIVVVENSLDRPLTYTQGIEVIDNRNGQLVDFGGVLSMYPDRTPIPNELCSARHCLTIDACTDIFTDGFVLLDSDTLVRKNLDELIDERYAVVSDFDVLPPKWRCVERFLPYCQWINVPMLRTHAIRYFNGEWMWKLTNKLPNKWYDTGAWLFKIVRERKLPWKRIHHLDYVAHLGHASFGNRYEDFLTKNKDLWQD